MKKDVVIGVMENLNEYKRQSTCNRRQTAAAIFLRDGTAYRAVNGSKDDPCTGKGPDYCQRGESNGTLQYIKCPSNCAEGNVIIGALYNEKDLEGSTLISTDFPCDRCRSIIIDSGKIKGSGDSSAIKELYFADYKVQEERPRDNFYLAQMELSGVSVFRVWKAFDMPEKGIKTELSRIRSGLEDSYAAMFGARISGEFYLRLICDKDFREYHRKILEEIESDIKSRKPAPGIDGLEVTFLL